MPQKATNVNQQAKQNGGLPVSIHPDDAKDKVFTAILKALLKLGNKPSSPKELANTIVKHKYATLGGATPFATVSSRISQHFKRAAEHNPPRAPLLAKHVDQNHSRKINYSLATTDSVSNEGAATETHDDNKTAASTAETLDGTSDNGEDSSATTSDKMTAGKKLRSRTMMEEQQKEAAENEHAQKKLKHSSRHTTSIHPTQPSSIEDYSFPQPTTAEAEEEHSEGELSDYHEEMLKGDDTELDAGPRSLQRQSALDKSSSKTNNPTTSKDANDTDMTHSTITHSAPPSPPTTQESVLPDSSPPTASAINTNTNTNTTTINVATTTESKLLAPSSSSAANQDGNSNNRKPSFSFSSGFPGDQELWTPFSFEHDFDNVFLQDASTAHHIPFHIATPESVSVSELDDYFASTSNSTTRTQRKSFSSAMLGPNDKSLLQKVLLASAARGVADKIDQVDEAKVDSKKEAQLQESTKASAAETATADVQINVSDNKQANVAEPSTPEALAKPVQSISSSSLMDVDNGEDFVRFEDDEKKEVAAAISAPLPPPIDTTPPAAPAKKIADILPTATPTALSTAELLKAMNIQNLNLSALQQMTSNIPSLQHLSPTFDLAKTMAAYMQSLAKSASANASSSSSPHAADLKTILARFPALEAFIKKEPSSTPPLMSPTTPNAAAAVNTTQQTSSSSSSSSATPTDLIPNLISPSTASSFTAGSTEPIVHTLTTMNPPMYITLIDHIAVCIVVLPKTESTPEYRIMRRVDTGFINGTVLLTAGGIETESERSMILSFEMERVRMPKKKSQLFGTWIPLRRAQELAVTCSIQHKLGHFLEDSIEPYFPSPLPIQVNTRKPARDSRLTALALAALRSETKNNRFIVPPISRQSSSSGSMAAAQLQELLLTHPHKALKSNGLLGNKAPLLGRYDDKDEPIMSAKTTHQQKQQRNNSSASASSSRNSSGISDKEESDVDVVNSSDSSAVSSNEEESDTEADAKARNPTAATASSSQQPTINFEELLNRVTPKQPMHIHPRDLQKKRRRSLIVEKDKEEPVPKASKSSYSRKKNNSAGNNGNGSGASGKWSNNSKSSATVAIKKSGGGSGTTITIKRPAASAASSISGKKSNNKKEDENSNLVVKHTAPKSNLLQASATTSSEGDDDTVRVKSAVTAAAAVKSSTENEDDDEGQDDDDEDIDIGGSDFDDDLR
ncbi:hypothetical protein [Parasitella parasitica]|uniref:HTH APSES-type domain-containing protein n=1 Tax=Parasitella parasitica TaxID=35722 RepID=A0A0B7N854_9FUNG|nr:hypothetical protein [Parasitella parasitica]